MKLVKLIKEVFYFKHGSIMKHKLTLLYGGYAGFMVKF